MNIYVDILFWVRQKKWLLIALGYALIMHFFVSPPPDLERAAYASLIIISMALILIITEPLPLPAIAMLMLFMQVILGIDSANDVASSFMNDAVFFIMGSLMLAVAIVSQGLDKRLALGIIRITGHKTWRIIVGFTAISALLSSFIGEHTVAAMMMPVGLTLVKYAHKDPKKVAGLTAALLFSIAYGATIGSVGTPSGGGRNVIMMNYWAEFGAGSVSYLEWMKYVYPMVIFQIPFTVMILWFTFKPEQAILDSAVRKLVVDVAHSGKVKGQEWLAIILFILVFLGWVFLSEDIGLGVIALMGVFAYLAFGLVDWSELNRKTNWGVILLFGSAISLGIQMNNTGAAEWVAQVIIHSLSKIITSPAVLQGSVSVLLTGTMSNILSSSATVAVVGPIVLDLGGDKILIGFATAIASAFGYFTAVAAPACTIIYSSGLVSSRDFLRAGWKMGLLSVASLLGLSILWWPVIS